MDDAFPETVSPSTLSAQDAAALDWLAEHGWDAEAAPPEFSDRAKQIVGLLGSLESDRSAFSLAHSEASFQAILRALPDAGGLAEPAAVLSEADGDALDAWMMAGHRAEKVPASLRPNASVHDRIAELFAARPDHAAADDTGLVGRTLAYIDASQLAASETRHTGWALPRMRMSDLVSIAAVLLIGVSVLWPAVTMSRISSLRAANQSNLAAAGIGFGAYSADHDDSLPMVSPRRPSDQWVWWEVGDDPAQSNSANLYSLHRLGYASLASLASPGNPNAPTRPAPAGAMDWDTFDEVSYSYTLSAESRPSNPSGEVVLADRSPVTLRAFRRQPVYLGENSPNHRGRGQHLLLGDGAVNWLTSPVTATGDHVYLPRPIELVIRSLRERRELTFEALNAPHGPADAFVGP